jgi:hypothetical protein
MSQTDGYDIVGDIHGQAGALKALLKKLGYREQGGAWRYPGGTHQAIFIGDYIDRNPHGLEVIDIVRRMTEHGEAHAVMGNHEFNAVAYHTEDPRRPGEFLRPHSEKNRHQHAEFLREVEGNETAHNASIEWFKTLPVWLDLGELRVVHASWVPRHQAVIGHEFNPGTRLSAAGWVRASRMGTTEFEAIECLLKGMEAQMPDGAGYRDSYGTLRSKVRIRWWLGEPPAMLSDAIIASPEMVEQVEGIPWRGGWPAEAGYPLSAPPVFIGHYWQTGVPEPQAPNVACVDYSAAKKGNKLVAYRWDGESILRKSGFVSVTT